MCTVLAQWLILDTIIVFVITFNIWFCVGRSRGSRLQSGSGSRTFLIGTLSSAAGCLMVVQTYFGWRDSSTLKVFWQRCVRRSQELTKAGLSTQWYWIMTWPSWWKRTSHHRPVKVDETRSAKECRSCIADNKNLFICVFYFCCLQQLIGFLDAKQTSQFSDRLWMDGCRRCSPWRNTVRSQIKSLPQ